MSRPIAAAAAATMRAIRLHPAPAGSPPYSPTNPAPSTALHLDDNLPVPQPRRPGEVCVRVKASTVIRDTLTWPETYVHEYTTPGHDLAGVVVGVFEGGVDGKGEDGVGGEGKTEQGNGNGDENGDGKSGSRFKVGDEVFGMMNADRPGAWAEYALVREEEIVQKPEDMAWEAAAALPLSGSTAYEALFVHAGVGVPGRGQEKRAGQETEQKVLITGAAGAVGVYVVQLARLAGLRVTAATSSNARNAEFLRELGASESVEYAALGEANHQGAYDIVIDTVGGQPLVEAWKCVRDKGTLITVDSSSWNFVEEHAKQGISRDGVKALFFIVQGGPGSLGPLARFASEGNLRVFVLDTYPLEKTQEAYERANGRLTGRGKIVLSI